MRALARGPSGMLTTSTPWNFSSSAAARTLAASWPRGGFISTETTKRCPSTERPASLAPKRRALLDRGPARPSWPVSSGSTARHGATVWRGLSALTMAAIARMCSGVVPQQPPTRSGAGLDEAPGVLRHVLRRGHVEDAVVVQPRVTGVRHRGDGAVSGWPGGAGSTVSSMSCGPSEQLAPATSTAEPARARSITSSGV